MRVTRERDCGEIGICQRKMAPNRSDRKRKLKVTKVLSRSPDHMTCKEGLEDGRDIRNHEHERRHDLTWKGVTFPVQNPHEPRGPGLDRTGKEASRRWSANAG